MLICVTIHVNIVCIPYIIIIFDTTCSLVDKSEDLMGISVISRVISVKFGDFGNSRYPFYYTHVQVSVVLDIRERVRDLVSPLHFILRRSSLGQKKIYACLRLPDRPYFFWP